MALENQIIFDKEKDFVNQKIDVVHKRNLSAILQLQMGFVK